MGSSGLALREEPAGDPQQALGNHSEEVVVRLARIVVVVKIAVRVGVNVRTAGRQITTISLAPAPVTTL